MAVGDLTYAFRPEEGETPETLARRRSVAEMLAASALGRTPQNVGEGLSSIGRALIAAQMTNEVGASERGAEEAASSAWREEFSPLLSGGSPVSGTMDPSQRVAQAHGDFETAAATVIPRLAQDLNITPEQAAGVVGQLGHESAGLQAINERDPLVPGSRGGFGWAQWTGPRRRQFEEFAAAQGMDVTDPEANYTYLLHELTATPEAKVVQAIRQAPDAQTAGRVFTDQFLRPGIPGYGSRAKWTNRALAAYQSAIQSGASPAQATQAAEAQQSGGVQVASLDPSAGVAEALAAPQGVDPMQTAGIFIGTPEELEAQRAARGGTQGRLTQPEPMGAPQTLSDGAFNDRFGGVASALTNPAPIGGQPMPLQPMDPMTTGAASPAQDDPYNTLTMGARPLTPEQAAQMGPFPDAPGMTTGAIGGQQGAGLSRLVEVLGNPWLSDSQRRIGEALLQQELQQQAQAGDPMRQLELERAQLEIEQMRNPQPGFRVLSSEESAQMGLPEGSYQIGGDGKISQIGKAGVEVNLPGEPNIGTIPQGFEAYQQPDGSWRMRPIPGGPAAVDEEAAERQAEVQTQTEADKASTMLDATSNIKRIMEDAETPTTGTLSRPFAAFSGTAAGKIRSYVGTLQSGVALGAMLRLKEASAQGATGFGAMNEKELQLLIDDIGALNPDTTDPEIFMQTIERIENRWNRAVNDIRKNVSPERIQELGLGELVAGGGAGAEDKPISEMSDEELEAIINAR